jgi:hypothetical protein
METFTVHIQKQLAGILESLSPKVDRSEIEKRIVSLIEEINLREDEVKQRAAQRMTDILDTYQHRLTAAHQQVETELFRLIAQLEYPSRQ